MRRLSTIVVATAALWACGGDSDSSGTGPTDDPGGQCGAVEEFNILIRAKVVDVDGAPVAGAEVRVFESGWHQPEKIWASAVTDGTGVGEFTANGIVSVEDCWGVVLNYRLVAQQGDTIGEDSSYNSSLFNAINNGEPYVADSTGSPLILQ